MNPLPHPSLPAPAWPQAAALLDAPSLSGALDALDTGVLVATARGRLLLANAAARQLLDQATVLQVDDAGQLDVAGGAGVLSLRRALQGAAEAHSHHLVPLRRGEQQLILSVQPLPGADGLALVLTGRLRLCDPLALQRLAQLYALTPSEQEVLLAMLQGERVSQMSLRRQVQLCTVRTQVASLRAKFGVRRIDDILRVVAGLPPMRGALRGGGGRTAPAAPLPSARPFNGPSPGPAPRQGPAADCLHAQ